MSVLLLAMIGAVTFELILPIAWNRAKSVSLPAEPLFVMAATWVTVLALLFVICEPVRFRRGQWRGLLRYPPTLVAVPGALVIAAASEWLPAPFRPQVNGPDWQHAFPVVLVAAALLLALMLRHTGGSAGTPAELRQPAGGEGLPSWSDIERWIAAGERPKASFEADLFGHQALGLKVADLVGRQGRRVALLGPYGSGKSSILNVTRSALQALKPRVVVAGLDVWAVQAPEEVPRRALNRIIAALDEHVDTIEFRRLPAAYQRLAAAEPTGRLSTILGLEDTADSIDELRGLSPLLEALDLRIVLIVEDVDRAGEQFDARHLARLLWALREVPRTSFILAVDSDHAPLDFSKLCDAIELIPPMDARHVRRIIHLGYGHWLKAYSFIDPNPATSRADKLQLQYAEQDGLLDYMRRTGRNTPIDALVSVLETPRSLKHVLRSVDEAWEALHGEAELDDIIIIAALRHGAPKAFRFLVQDIDPARHKPDDVLARTKSVKADWDRLIDRLPNGEGVRRLVDLMGIHQLSTTYATIGAASLQGVHSSDPVDYFRRIVAGQVDRRETRDQRVLRDISGWKDSSSDILLRELLQATAANDRYVEVWEHFETRHSTAELIALTERVVNELLVRDGALAAGDHPALLALWRCCLRRLAPNEKADWLAGLLLSALPISLRMVNDLYYYWTGRHGIVDTTMRLQIRAAVVDTVKTTLRSATDLSRLLPRNRAPYELKRLITQTGADPSPAAFSLWRDWLPSLIADGLTSEPEVFTPEVATLFGDKDSGTVAARDDYPPHFMNPYRIDRLNAAALVPDLNPILESMANYSGEDPYAKRARDDARAWLTERQQSLQQ